MGSRSMRLGILSILIFGVFPIIALAAEIHVPTDQPTIQSAILAASSGDTVTVACGTYLEHDILVATSILLRSEDGTPDCVTIDGERKGRVMMWQGLDNTAVFEGLTITGGAYPDSGGAVLCDNSDPYVLNCRFKASESTGLAGGGAMFFLDSNPVIEGCAFTDNTGNRGGALSIFTTNATLTDCDFARNHSTVHGAAIYFGLCPTSTVTNVRFVGNTAGGDGGSMAIVSASPLIEGCLIVNNSAGVNGGAVWVPNPDSDPVIRNCTIVGNTGNTILYVNGNHATVESSIVAFNTAVLDLVNCSPGSSVDIFCSDLFGNAPANWTQCISDQENLNDNISVDPAFCARAVGDLTLHQDSPCLPGNHPSGAQCGLIGALGEGCSGTGACCFEDGTCVAELFPSACTGSGGVFQGVGTTCEPGSCPDLVVGACCVGGGCIVTNDGNCSLSGGTYLGDGVSCSPNPCPGACCFDEVCGILLQPECSGAGGEFLGSGVACDPGTCDDPVGACCLVYGSCVIAEEETCLSNGHSYLGDSTVCDPDPCPTPAGACCLPNESCVILTQVSCESNGWNYIGNGTSCDTLPCAPTAAPGAQVLPTHVILTRPAPNPAANSIRLAVGLPQEATVHVEIYDVTGALVARVAEGPRAAGMHQLEWDLRNGDGSRVPQGTYYIRLQASGVQQSHRLVVLR